MKVPLLTMALLDMARKDILPAVDRYTAELKKSLTVDDSLGILDKESYTYKNCMELTGLSKKVYTDCIELQKKLDQYSITDNQEAAFYYHDEIIPLMASIRTSIDQAEVHTDRSCWPMPSYRELLFGLD